MKLFDGAVFNSNGMKRFFYFFLFYLFSFIVTADEAVCVFVSILPQKYFVEKIGQKRVKVSVLVQPGYEPHSYEPKPRQMMELAAARIYFAIGFPFEQTWLSKFRSVNPSMLIVQTDEGIRKVPSVHHEQAGEKGENEVLDPHIWLSPVLVRKQALTIKNALIRADPMHQDQYESNFRQFDNELSGLHQEFKRIFSEGTLKNRAFLVYHPSWGYFARDYHLDQIPIEQEGKEPKPQYLEQLIIRSRTLGIKVVLIQPEYSVKMAQTIASATGAKVITADVMSENWGENLKKVSRELQAAMQE
ncbi:MAG: zinc ABC transporter substrate-binding protein [Candidatus Aureabacteria bacterium]|nr:zinc ABC transporter substrate-binding protein [Candidatus Auribacterota bacterium]